ncbi:MAG: hypothetical protein ABSA03_14430 [Streptosporangiaceae bacterium]
MVDVAATSEYEHAERMVGELAHEYAPPEEDLERTRRELGQAPPHVGT